MNNHGNLFNNLIALNLGNEISTHHEKRSKYAFDGCIERGREGWIIDHLTCLLLLDVDCFVHLLALLVCGIRLLEWYNTIAWPYLCTVLATTVLYVVHGLPGTAAEGTPRQPRVVLAVSSTHAPRLAVLATKPNTVRQYSCGRNYSSTKLKK